jgi:hypothetical protein
LISSVGDNKKTREKISPKWSQAWKWMLAGAVWGAATSPVLLSVAVRESMRMWLGQIMTLLALVLPIIWSAVLLDEFALYMKSDIRRLLATILAPILGALAAYILCIIYNARMRYKREMQETINNESES